NMVKTSFYMLFMRLTEIQKNNIVDSFIKVFNSQNAELWLFGSRIDNSKFGGDIDLLIKCYKDYSYLLELKEKYEFLLQKKIGPRKIDIILEFSPESQQSPVVMNAKNTGILLATTPFPKGFAMLKDQNLLYQKLKTYMQVINFNLETEEGIEKIIKDLNWYPITE